jgi:hypothetical protein
MADIEADGIISMAAELRTQGRVYRMGKRRNKDFTPRDPKDIKQPDDPDRLPGLSTRETPDRKQVNQIIDLALLQEPLKAFADAPNHVVIVPVNEQGEVDHEKLKEWASYRDKQECHPLTQILLDAIVGQT